MQIECKSYDNFSIKMEAIVRNVGNLRIKEAIPGRVIPKTQKIVLVAALLNTQHYKVGIKGKEEQSKE